MRALLDVNMLVALLDRQSAARPTALAWMAAHLEDGWASYPITENGCLRVLTNTRYPAPASTEAVPSELHVFKQNGRHEFWPDDLSITDVRLFERNYLRGHQQVTDAYLLALAVAHGGRLVTFDQRVPGKAVTGSRPEHLVVL